MKILYASTGYKPAYRLGGPIISVASVAEMLVRKGHEVTVFTTNCDLDKDLNVPLDQPLDVDGVEVWYFRRQEWIKKALPFVPYLSRSIGYLYAPRMRAELDRLVPQVDLVHTQGPFVYPTLATARAARRWHKPLFYSQRGGLDPESLRFRRLKKQLYIAAVERPIMNRAAALIALTETERESYQSLGVEAPIRIVPNGVDVEEFRSGSEAAAGARWGIPSDALVVLFLGRLHPSKGAQRLLEAFLRTGNEISNAYLVMAGPDEWKLEDRFRRAASGAKAGARVLFPGMVFGQEKVDLLTRADLFCLPSEGEGFSIAILEALASATPVLITPGCHFPAVEAAGAGQICSSDPETLAAALASLLRSPERLREVGLRGREFVARDYSWEHVTELMLAVYREGLSTG